MLRLLTRNGHTVDFGTVVHTTTSSLPVMLVNGGHADLHLNVTIASDSNLFSFSDEEDAAPGIDSLHARVWDLFSEL